ncbi:MAG: tRNA (guanosine(37)-N1)-methyltransferase TrmD [Bdellovibrionales bacterium]|nr:tRNA (guanosine(37)-N1)-methyltransferase TrmD [Bdellovibrionales bacterium]
MQFNVITLFPQLIDSLWNSGLIGQALEKEILRLQVVNPRDFTTDVHKTIDDRPYGGGDGMVLKAEPFAKALDSIENPGRIVALTAHGVPWSHEQSVQWAKEESTMTLICGRYAGFDQRFLEFRKMEQISVGDFIVSGGEWPACMMIDSIARHLPGVLGHPDSSSLESFASGLLEAPQFTRPSFWEEMEVPEPLISGNHALIEKFRNSMALLTTLKHRPDLLKSENLERSMMPAFNELKKLSFSQQSAMGLEYNELLKLWEKYEFRR